MAEQNERELVDITSDVEWVIHPTLSWPGRPGDVEIMGNTFFHICSTKPPSSSQDRVVEDGKWCWGCEVLYRLP